jgi:hypothetical protein
MIPHFLGVSPWEIIYSKKSPNISDLVMITQPDQITVNAWLSEVPDECHFQINSR